MLARLSGVVSRVLYGVNGSPSNSRNSVPNTVLNLKTKSLSEIIQELKKTPDDVGVFLVDPNTNNIIPSLVDCRYFPTVVNTVSVVSVYRKPGSIFGQEVSLGCFEIKELSANDLPYLDILNKRLPPITTTIFDDFHT